jgi:hypothetical protein
MKPYEDRYPEFVYRYCPRMPEKLKLAIADKNFSLPPETAFFNTMY